MIYVKFSKRLTKRDVAEKIKHFENKYGMPLGEYEEKVVKGHEEELDERGLLGEFDRWKYYVDSLKEFDEGKPPLIVESITRPMPPGSKGLEIFVKVFTKERVRLFDKLKGKGEVSVTNLSELLNRDRSSVMADIDVLKEAGLMQLQKKGKLTIPQLKYDKIAVEF